MHFRATDAPPQSMTETDQWGHYLEITETSSHGDQESTSDNDHYDKPELPYEGLDPSTVTQRPLPPPPSVYEDLTH